MRGRRERHPALTCIAIAAAGYRAIHSTLPEDAPLWPVHRRDG